MDALLKDTNGLVITKCDCSGQCMYVAHSISTAELEMFICIHKYLNF